MKRVVKTPISKNAPNDEKQEKSDILEKIRCPDESQVPGVHAMYTRLSSHGAEMAGQERQSAVVEGRKLLYHPSCGL